MAKNKTIYSCQNCGSQFPKWMGQCSECGKWNSIVAEETESGATACCAPISLSEVPLNSELRFTTEIKELDRVLGGGIVFGSVVLVGGDPGVGKSTLLLQTLSNLGSAHGAVHHGPTIQDALYVTGEESLQQVALRARRLNLAAGQLQLLAETNVEKIIANARKNAPKVIVIDSIQTMYSSQLQSAPGGIAQVRESAAQLVRYAKQTETALFIVGHVTKEGTLAGPRVLEHMVDCVLYFEGEKHGKYRIIRAAKNRFGATNELGVFVMTNMGLKEVSNPSAIFLSRYTNPTPGSLVMATWEGSRPLLVEVQALVDSSYLTNPRRVTIGLDHYRLSMLLAVLHRHGGTATFDQDVFVNIVGGVRVVETAADLTLLLAIVSSLRNKPLTQDLIAFGEVGLSGEIRPVQNGQERLQEALKHGFKKAIIPHANAPKKTIPGMEIIAVKNLVAAIGNC